MLSVFFGWLLSLLAVLLVIIVLLQRGRGGGLAGALGGGGGQSAFGTKAGDVFTKITVTLAAVWIVLCIVALKMLSPSTSSKFSGGSESEQRAPAKPGEVIPAGKTTGTPATSGSATASKSSAPAGTSGAAVPAAPASKTAAPAAPATK